MDAHLILSGGQFVILVLYQRLSQLFSALHYMCMDCCSADLALTVASHAEM